MKQTIRNKSSLINTSINFRETQLKMLKKLAMDKGVTLSALIRKIIDQCLGGKNA